jgi:hypothetical protein
MTSLPCSTVTQVPLGQTSRVTAIYRDAVSLWVSIRRMMIDFLLRDDPWTPRPDVATLGRCAAYEPLS